MVNDWYAYPSNYSNGTEVNGFGDFIKYVSSELTSNYLATGFILAIWLLTFGFCLVADSKKALMASSFITLLLSIPLLRMGLINISVLITLIILTIVGAILSYKE